MDQQNGEDADSWMNRIEFDKFPVKDIVGVHGIIYELTIGL